MAVKKSRKRSVLQVWKFLMLVKKLKLWVTKRVTSNILRLSFPLSSQKNLFAVIYSYLGYSAVTVARKDGKVLSWFVRKGYH